MEEIQGCLKEEVEEIQTNVISQKQQCRHHGDYSLDGTKGNWVKIFQGNKIEMNRTQELEVIKFREKAPGVKVKNV